MACRASSGSSAPAALAFQGVSGLLPQLPRLTGSAGGGCLELGSRLPCAWAAPLGNQRCVVNPAETPLISSQSLPCEKFNLDENLSHGEKKEKELLVLLLGSRSLALGGRDGETLFGLCCAFPQPFGLLSPWLKGSVGLAGCRGLGLCVSRGCGEDRV